MSINVSRAIVGLMTLALAGCGSKSATSPSGGGGTGSSSSSATVSMPAADYGTGLSTFNPGSVTINVGGSVTWKNDDTTSHTSTSNSPGWDMTVAAGSSVSRTFSSKGTFAYHCSIHSNMTGVVIVQ